MHLDERLRGAGRRTATEGTGRIIHVAVECDGLDADFFCEGNSLGCLRVVADEGVAEDVGNGFGDLVFVSDEGESRADFARCKSGGSVKFLSIQVAD